MNDAFRGGIAPPLDELRPMVYSVGRAPFTDAEWTFELKLNGHRMLAEFGGGPSRLRSPRGIDTTEWFPEVAEALGGLPLQRTVLDGQLCVLEGAGLGDMERLHRRSLKRGGTDGPPVVYCIFDVLVHEGENVMWLPWSERRRRLSLLPLAGVPHLRLRRAVQAEGVWLQRQAQALGVVSMWAKRLDSVYTCGERSPHWLLLDCQAPSLAPEDDRP
jgi:bifunctional non-homologous end joining protein LigD